MFDDLVQEVLLGIAVFAGGQEESRAGAGGHGEAATQEQRADDHGVGDALHVDRNGFWSDAGGE